MTLDVHSFSARFPQLVDQLRGVNLAALVAAFREVEVDDGAPIVAQGQPVEGLILAWAGRARVRSGENELGEVGPGSMLGEVAWIDRGPATATLTANGDMTCLILDREVYARLRTEHPVAAAHLLRGINRSIATRLRAADARFEQVSAGGGDAPERRRGLFESFFALFAAPES
ncbi:hypothetical protein LBMAG42_45460 [Deltaproteobacteria bacterium]|nr:hypothetical protein LBMAG42_45460 [Deltaproteobacteria bacterium]